MLLGTKHSQETRVKLSISHLGHIPWNKQEHTDTICAFCKIVFPFSHMRKKFCSHKCFTDERKSNGIFVPWNKGIPISEEVRQKMSKSKKGQIAWNKGIISPFSKETILKMRVAKLGRKLSQSTRLKLSEAHKGNKSHLWRGGVTDENRQIRGQVEYRLWRESIFARDNWTCQECGIRGGKLQADHIKPFALFPELRLAIDNGRTLCVTCHRKTDTWGGKSKPK